MAQRPAGDIRSMSHGGRGGAGNISSKQNKDVDPSDLKTPIIKSQTYTTGRGGTGNMVPNDSPAAARAAQDVEAPAHHEKEARGTYHWGRGGEGNMVTIGSDQRPPPKSSSRERKSSQGAEGRRRGSFQNTIEKGKAMFGLSGGKSKQQGGEKNGRSPVFDEEKER